MQHKTPFLFLLLLSVFLSSACNNDKPCDNLDCGAHGACVIGEDLKPRCACEPGYYGEFCQNFDPCLLITCANGGTKEPDADDPSKCHCVCPPEYDGPSCEQQNYCFGITCENGGTAVNDTLATRCVCECPPGFIGEFCQTPNPCNLVDCYPNATCQLTANLEPVCVCNPGWEGDMCETEIREKYIGTYNAKSYYTDGSSVSYTCEISKHPDDVTKMYLSTLLQNPNPAPGILLQNVYAVVYQSNTFAIPVQNVFPNNEQVKSVSIGQRNPANGVVTVFYTYIKNDTTQLQLELTPQ
ncbi:hypothetical protein C7N43_28090 [Sphingobacteriales bacterium UPWRP_1]|nr:hypothetical protein B6N25_03155 [Sphingobacteriales bacterium TSM_CSS]PSJ73645.1 hypothetical protein C7N43_28090 [Sphingobacteriales bacterium UPWRP_1]